METLTKAQFKIYSESVNVLVECDLTFVQDEYGNVCTLNNTTEESEFEPAMFEGNDYQLTEEQKDKLHAMAIEQKNFEQGGAEPFTQEDREHALSLIY